MTDIKWTKNWKNKNDNQNNTKGERVRAQLRHLKKKQKQNSTWLWLIKIFYTIKKKYKASEKHANCLKTLYGKFRQFANVIQMFAKENGEASPHEVAHSI